jgi:esterase/lipase superfamily enzyme
MRRDHVQLEAPAIGGAGDVIAYGHFGRPALVFPPEQGRAWDVESGGLVDAVLPLIEGGRVKLYCVDSHDAASWSDRSIPLEEPARRHAAYESWILDQVVPFVYADCAGAQEILTTGLAVGAFHAANFALKRPDTFPTAICLSGNYEWPEVTAPVDFVTHLDGDHLDWVQSRLQLVLVCGQGEWEDKSGALESTQRLAAALAGKDIRHEVDLWEHDVTDAWSAWRDQLAHHLPRFC